MNVRKPRRLAVGFAASLASIVPISVALPSGIVSAGGPAAVATNSVSSGATGDEVRKVQEALISAGYLPAGSADGVFGSKTKSAVERFQAAHGLNGTGEVGDATSIALGIKSSTYFGLKTGSNGDSVQALQQKLQSLGYSPGAVDGIFGSSTAYAVKKFQQSLGYLQTGRVNAATAAALEARSSGASAASTSSTSSAASGDSAAQSSATGTAKDYTTFRMSVGNSGDQVKRVQQVLMELKYDVVGGADGYYGAMTANAMRAFQRDNGVAADGIVGPITAALLEKARQGSLPGASTTSSGNASSIEGLATGATGSAVKTLQQRLLDVGVPLTGSVDGIFGPATARAVRLFQGWNGIEKSGKVDAKTAAALNGAKAVSSADAKPSGDIGYAVYGERSSRVTTLQQQLVNAGISVKGGVDGVFGGGTSAAVMSFQRKNGLNVTGVVSEATAEKLGLAKADKPAESSSSTSSSTPSSSSPSSSGGGYLKVFPVQGWCGFSDTWGDSRSGGRSHIGTDIIAAQGKLLYAVNDGVIEKIYSEASDRLSGNGVRLRMADGTYAFYAHMAGLGPGISLGTRVTAGQVVGTVGTTGNAYTPHLHFEIHPKGGGAINPYPYLKAIDGCQVTAPR